MQHILNASIIQRLTAALVVILIACGAAVALSGCANDEQVIRDAIAEQLDVLKNPTKENIASITSTNGSNTLSELLGECGIDEYVYYQHVLRGFDYSIGSIEVNGDTATAEVAITNMNVVNVIDETNQRLKNDPEMAAKLAEVNQNEGHAGMMRFYFNSLFDALDAVTESTTTDLKLKLWKNGNQWMVDESSQYELSAAIFGTSY